MFLLKDYLSERSGLIDRKLDEVLRTRDIRPRLLHEAMRYSIFTGGKRLRPVICLAACELAGGRVEDAIPAALAVEIFHTYTLVHDDLPCMDNDDFRRGKPTAHKKYGEANAVLSGDALQAMCFEVLASASPPPPYTMNQLIIEMAQAAGSTGVVGGQVEDIAANGTIFDEDTLHFIHQAKTARLFSASARMGAMCAGAGIPIFEKISIYGENLGLAFQLADDILDGKQDSTEPGKLAGDGNLSCLALMSAGEAVRRMKHHLAAAEQALSCLNKELSKPLLEIARYIQFRVDSGADVPDKP